MDKISKDDYWLIYSWCSVSDWARSRRLSKHLLMRAEHLDVVQEIFVRAGGHPSEKFETAEEYKERIYERLRFARWLNDPNGVRIEVKTDFFRTSEEDSAAHAQHNWLKPCSLAPAGMSECVFIATRVNARSGGDDCGFIWNFRTGELVRKTEGGGISSGQPSAIAFRVGTEPRLARLQSKKVEEYEVEWHVLLENPKDGSHIATYQLRGTHAVWAMYSSPGLIYVANNDSDSALLVVGMATEAHNAVLDPATLKEKEGTDFFKREQRCRLQKQCGMTVHNSSLNLPESLSSQVLEIEKNLHEEDPDSEFRTYPPDYNIIEVGDRNYVVFSRRKDRRRDRGPAEIRIHGYDQVIPGCLYKFKVIGGRWGDHDYLIFFPQMPRKLWGGLIATDYPLYIWRDDDTVKKFNGAELYSYLPIFGELNSVWLDGIVPLSDGLAIWCPGATEPIILRASPPATTAAPATYGRTRLFLIAGLTVLALGILANRWLRPFGR